MGFTHGGGYFLATKCSNTFAKNKGKTLCCVMDQCCCKPTDCHCPKHAHLLNMEQDGVAQLTSPDCSPIKKMTEVGFDTTPIVLPSLEKVAFLFSKKELVSSSLSPPLSVDPKQLFRPQQV